MRLSPNTMKRAIALASLLLIAACATNRAAQMASKSNRVNITRVELGQTMNEVLRIMGHDPEIRDIRMSVERGTEEVWSYVTEYENDIVTEITFRDRRVVGKKTTIWNQAFSRDTIAPGENLDTPEEAAARPSSSP